MIFLNNLFSAMSGNVTNLTLSILLLPFLSFLTLFFFANHLPRKGDLVATLFSGLTFILSIILFIAVWDQQVVRESLVWFKISNKEITISMVVNNLSSSMLVLVSFISLLVHIYSLEYMKGKKNYARYFPYLGIFTFSMIGIVISDNILITFMFWELVGFSSYLLIGFWYDKEAAVKAAKKAFLFNRIGDTGFIIAILAIYSSFHSFDLGYIQQELTSGSLPSTFILWIIGLGIFLGCVGKSAQFPLQAWLPDAMEGPTPASALIHAATMVAAGVYLLIKVFFLLSADVLTVIAFTGAITAIMGALPALFQNDIKKVLAYSTVSQLGYMVMGIGVGAFNASFFHLITHGFFKACLFLSAGAVIHSMHDVKHELFVKGKYRIFDSQDMRLMGGFRTTMPLTFICYVLSAAALVGLPLFSGFLSKDALLEGAAAWAQSGNNSVLWIVPIVAYITVFFTAVYMVRQIIMIFFNDFRLEKKFPYVKEVMHYVKDPSSLMLAPLLLLSAFCFWFVFSLNPLSAENGWLFKTGPLHISTALVSILLSAGGLLLGYIIYRNKNYLAIEGPIEANSQGPQGLLQNNWYLDRIYYYVLVIPGITTAKIAALADVKIIDRFIHVFAISQVVLAHIIAWLDKVLVDGLITLLTAITSKLGAFSRSFQTGRIHGYFIFAIMATIILLIWIIIQ